MKYLFLICLLHIGGGCHKSGKYIESLQNQIDSLNANPAPTYKPDLGEMMLGIQAHHSKLWSAGQNENWRLAAFESDEIKEAVTDIQTFETERKESKLINMLNPALDSMNDAIVKKNILLFNKSFELLTNTCNKCHQVNNYDFNVIKIPDSSPFTNQDFRVNN